MPGIYRFVIIIFGLILIVWGLFFSVIERGNSTSALWCFAIGALLLVVGALNGGRRLFDDPDASDGEDAVELAKDVAYRSSWTYALQNFGFLRALSGSSAQKSRLEHRRQRVEEKRRRLESAKAVREQTEPAASAEQLAEAEAPVAQSDSVRSERLDAASKPEMAPSTIVNSAWVWTVICYILVIATAMSMITQTGLDVFAERSRTPMLISLVVLVYPAWRIGSLFSRFLRKRGIGASAVVPVPGLGGGKPEPKAGSVEARMAARKARVAKAREEGKL